MESQFQARTLSTVEALDEHAGVWERLGPDLEPPTREFAWIRESAAWLRGNARLSVLLLDQPGALGIAPLVLGGSPVQALRFLGSEYLHEPMDMVYADPGSLTRLIDVLCRSGYPIILRPILAESPTVAAFRAVSRNRGVLVSRPLYSAPWIPLDASWSEPESHLNSGRRSDLRRARRNAEREGAVTFEGLTLEPGQVDAALEEAFRVESASWKGRSGSALVHDAQRRGFFRNYAAAASARRKMRVSFMRIGGRAVAMQIAIMSARRYWLLKIGYDETYARCSPGNILLAESIGAAAREGFTSYEFLGSMDQWIRVWTQRAHLCLDLRFYPARPRGMTALLADAPRLLWRAIRPKTWDRA